MNRYNDTLLAKSITILVIIGYTAIIAGTMVVLWGSCSYLNNVADNASFNYKMWLIGGICAIAYTSTSLINWCLEGIKGNNVG